MKASKSEQSKCRQRWAWWRNEWRYSVANKDTDRDIADARKQMRVEAAARLHWAALTKKGRAKRFGAAPGWPSLKWHAERPKRRGWWWVKCPVYTVIVFVEPAFTTGKLSVFEPGTAEWREVESEYFRDTWWVGPLVEPEFASSAEPTANP